MILYHVTLVKGTLPEPDSSCRGLLAHPQHRKFEIFLRFSKQPIDLSLLVDGTLLYFTLLTN